MNACFIFSKSDNLLSVIRHCSRDFYESLEMMQSAGAIFTSPEKRQYVQCESMHFLFETNEDLAPYVSQLSAMPEPDTIVVPTDADVSSISSMWGKPLSEADYIKYNEYTWFFKEDKTLLKALVKYKNKII